MKRIIAIVLVLATMCGACLALSSCGGDSADYTIGICQLMAHDSLDKATQGFIDAVTEKMEAAGKTVEFDTQIPADANLCSTVINTFTAKNVDLIMANATPALTAASFATTDIPILGTSVTDYESTFGGNIPANVSGTSDAVPFNEQAQMMIDTLGLKSGDKVGVIYCSNESNSLIQYNAVKALFEAKGIEAVAYTFSATTELSAVVTAAAESSKAIYVPSDNTVANNDTVVGTICSEKGVPVYTSYSSGICYASLAIDYYQLGYETGKMAAEILLDGKSPADIAVKTLTPTVMYNKEICAKLGITVPEN